MGDVCDLFNFGDFAIFEIEQTLVATATPFDGQIALGLDKWPVNQHVKRLNEAPGRTVVRNFFVNQARK